MLQFGGRKILLILLPDGQFVISHDIGSCDPSQTIFIHLLLSSRQHSWYANKTNLAV